MVDVGCDLRGVISRVVVGSLGDGEVNYTALATASSTTAASVQYPVRFDTSFRW